MAEHEVEQQGTHRRIRRRRAGGEGAADAAEPVAKPAPPAVPAPVPSPPLSPPPRPTAPSMVPPQQPRPVPPAEPSRLPWQTDPAARPSASKRDPNERGLRGLVAAGPSQVGVIGAMRARDAARPTAEDLAAAESDLVLVRRRYVPPDLRQDGTGGTTPVSS